MMDHTETGFTRFPNYFLDKVMRKAGGVEWKVICTVVRDTLGWQRDEAEIPIDRFEEMTGAKRSRLFEAITAACQLGAIKRPEQRSFRFRPLPKTNLQPVPKREKPKAEQGRLQFSQSENRTLGHEENTIIGLSQSENRSSPLLRKKEKTHTQSRVCESKYSRDFRERYAAKHNLGIGWLRESESGERDVDIDAQLRRYTANNQDGGSETIHERLRRQGVI